MIVRNGFAAALLRQRFWSPARRRSGAAPAAAASAPRLFQRTARPSRRVPHPRLLQEPSRMMTMTASSMTIITTGRPIATPPRARSGCGLSAHAERDAEGRLPAQKNAQKEMIERQRGW